MQLTTILQVETKQSSIRENKYFRGNKQELLLGRYKAADIFV